ncbi:hypothetical protein ACFP81_10540 [Deinococcus lacus]|uniref:Uncharacterized protein n=1 Tax=Deinococcus lacus TaxID=392561 RepID=A0ABW1YGY5_9DEIO
MTRQMTEADWAAAMREQLRSLEAAYQRSQQGRKWLKKSRPAPEPQPSEPQPYLGPLFEAQHG